MNLDTKHYVPSNVCLFSKAKEKWGEFGNMTGGFEFVLPYNGKRIFNSEGLYQAMRFPDYPEVQKEILDIKSGMGAKMRANHYRATHTRSDFEDVRIDIMRWCLQLKYASNFVRLSKVLKETRGRDIVEYSHKDRFWGTVPDNKEAPTVQIGQNVLGQLWMEIYKNMTEEKVIEIILPPDIPNCVLLGEPIPPIAF